MTPLLTALSSLREASRISAVALSASPAALASLNLRIAVFSDDLTALLRRRRFSFCRLRLIWDLMFATRQPRLSSSVRIGDTSVQKHATCQLTSEPQPTQIHDGRTYCDQGMFQAVQPSPGSRPRSVPRTVTGSPTSVVWKSQSALASFTLTHPCETLRCPWAPTDHGAAWMNCPFQVSRWAYAMLIRYPFGPSSAVVSKTVDSSLDMITIVPLEDGVDGLPRLTGIVRISWSFWKTCICLVALSTSMVSLRPIVTWADRSVSPNRAPIGRPDSALRTVSFVPGSQYFSGR